MKNTNGLWAGILSAVGGLGALAAYAFTPSRKRTTEEALNAAKDAEQFSKAKLEDAVHRRSHLSNCVGACTRVRDHHYGPPFHRLSEAAIGTVEGELAIYHEMLRDAENDCDFRKRDHAAAVESVTAAKAADDAALAAETLQHTARRAAERNGSTEFPPLVYVASSWRHPDSEDAVAQVRAAGFRAYDFKNPEWPDKTGGGFGWAAIDPHWKEWTPAAYREAMRHEVAQAGLAADAMALNRAEATILLTPCGRSAHLEAGYAKGRGQIVIAVALPGFEVELMWGLFDAIVLSMDEAIAVLQTAFPHVQAAPATPVAVTPTESSSDRGDGSHADPEQVP